MSDQQPMGQNTTADLSKAPLPTRKMLRRRRSLPVQVLRFVALNGRIMRMVRKGHTG